MMITKDLIERFFRNECTSAEHEQVMAYFKENPEVFGQYLDKTEWDQFQFSDNLLPETSVKFFENIKRQTTKKTIQVRWVKRVAVAASVMLMASAGWWYLRKQADTVPTASVQTITKDSSTLVVRHEFNNTRAAKTINIEDGSVVVLAENTEITYQLPFANSRQISLVGKADFKVAKDKTKPFIVTSGEITTTALGTQFTVTAQKGSNDLTVRLHEGKVVVQPVSKGNAWMKQQVYLMPGQEFVYDGKHLATVRDFLHKTKEAEETAANEESTKDKLVIPEKTNEPYFMFNNQSLGKVLKDLSALYNVKIIYSKQDIQKIYFTGKYDKSESLETILKRIATLHGLTITQKDSAFIITK